MKKKKKKERES